MFGDAKHQLATANNRSSPAVGLGLQLEVPHDTANALPCLKSINQLSVVWKELT